MTSELIKSKEELSKVADLLAEEIRNPNEDIVTRYTRVIHDTASFINGQKSKGDYCQANLNKEMMDRGIYTLTEVDDLLPHNVNEVIVARDLHEHRFNFPRKCIPLPTEEATFTETIPACIDLYDDEFRQFTREHKNSRLERKLIVEQKIIVNSQGGKVIQTIPFFGIYYSHGYEPIQTHRDTCVVCNSEEDIRRLPAMIKFLADPTPDRKIKSAKTFSEAFHQLHNISGLKFGSLDDAGIPLSGLYDVIMLTGTPIHEIFGHHFEEPIRHLDFGETGTFKYDQNIQNKGILIKDNPIQTIEGFRVLGFTNIDAYGRKREPRTHVKDGKVIEFLGSEYADRPEKFRRYLGFEKSPFVGNASQHTDGQFPQPRMSCTILDGPTEKTDLEGKILVISNTGHTQPQDKTYNVGSSEAYVIRGGIPRRIIPLQVTGGINQALENLVLLDDDTYQIGMCGKAEPIYYPQSRGKANVPVSQFTKSQMWKGQQVYPLPISDAHLRILIKPCP